jgi:hypothetical protein
MRADREANDCKVQCPVCSLASTYIIPSTSVISTLSDKLQKLEEYKVMLRAPRCEEFHSRGFCPRAPNCPNAHLLQDDSDLAFDQNGLQASRTVSQPMEISNAEPGPSVLTVTTNTSVDPLPVPQAAAPASSAAIDVTPMSTTPTVTDWPDPVLVNVEHLQKHPEELQTFLYKMHHVSSMFNIPIPLPPYT